MISIIVPCYNEEATIKIFLKEISKTEMLISEKYHESFEYIFIDDGSTDNTLDILKGCGVKYISFSRNFGKEAGLYAGLRAAKGDYVAVMDVDLQDPPELLVDMYESLLSGEYDCAATRRSTRKGEPKIRSFFAKCFYKLINKISDTEIVDGARDYRLMTRRMVDAILSVKEYNRFSKGLFSWVGFKTKWFEYENIERSAGYTKWSFKKLFLYSIDGMMSFSVVPLALASIVGMIMCFASIMMVLIIIAKTLIWGDPVAGYPSMICVILFLSGMQMLFIGILGQYLAKTYLETKSRPVYVVRDSNIDKPY
ncbi:MAG: glycosyltransferase family 2 protein [Clostridia bacterium]|nr:glycosyltransferase family 2 protein [Clostridia bacterium]